MMLTRRSGLVPGNPASSPYQRWQIVGGALVAGAILTKLVVFALVFRLKVAFLGPQGVVTMLTATFAVAAIGVLIGLTATYLDWRQRHRC
jgi:hypothetical protein